MTRRRAGALSVLPTLAASVLALAAASAGAAGGPLGIDQRIDGGANGIWNRHNQLFLQDAAWLVVVGGALWEGSDSRLGHTTWQSLDAMVAGTVTAEVMKFAFSRSRPDQGNDPNLWFQGRGHASFPSGEVMAISTAITPYVLEYGAEHPAVWALELLPLYDGVARVKSQAHWQSDVLASFVIGTGIGAYMHARPSSFIVGVVPRGVTIGWKHSF